MTHRPQDKAPRGESLGEQGTIQNSASKDWIEIATSCPVYACCRLWTLQSYIYNQQCVEVRFTKRKERCSECISVHSVFPGNVLVISNIDQYSLKWWMLGMENLSRGCICVINSKKLRATESQPWNNKRFNNNKCWMLRSIVTVVIKATVHRFLVMICKMIDMSKHELPSISGWTTQTPLPFL